MIGSWFRLTALHGPEQQVFTEEYIWIDGENQKKVALENTWNKWVKAKKILRAKGTIDKVEKLPPEVTKMKIGLYEERILTALSMLTMLKSESEVDLNELYSRLGKKND